MDVFVIIAIYVLLLALLFRHIGRMAQRRGHSPWPWWILSVVWSPFGTIAILWLFFPKLRES